MGIITMFPALCTASDRDATETHAQRHESSSLIRHVTLIMSDGPPSVCILCFNFNPTDLCFFFPRPCAQGSYTSPRPSWISPTFKDPFDEISIRLWETYTKRAYEYDVRARFLFPFVCLAHQALGILFARTRLEPT
jgi:hypothetical protein